VFVVQVDGVEPVEPAVVVDEPTAQSAVAGDEVTEKIAKGVALAVNRLLAAGVAAVDRRDAYFDGHGHILPTSVRQAGFRAGELDRLLGHLAVDDAERPELDGVRVAGRDENPMGLRPVLGIGNIGSGWVGISG